MNDNNTLYIQNADDLDSFHFMGGEYIPTDVYIAGMSDRGIKHSGNIKIESQDRRYCFFHVVCSTLDEKTAYIDFPMLFYRGYAAWDNDKKIKFEVEKNADGRVRVMVPSGYSGEINVHYQERWYWRAAELVSAICMFSLLLTGIRNAKSGPERGKKYAEG